MQFILCYLIKLLHFTNFNFVFLFILFLCEEFFELNTAFY